MVKAVEAAQSLFGGGKNLDNVPSQVFEKEKLEKGMNVVDFACETGFFASKSEARRMIEQGGFSIDGRKITSFIDRIDLSSADKDSVLLQRGKKNFLRIVLKKKSTSMMNVRNLKQNER